MKDTAIVLCVFGSSYEHGKNSINNFMKTIADKYTDYTVELSYTSKVVRKKLQQAGEAVKSLPQTISDLAESGIKKIIVQSLHVVPGYEYNDIHTIVRAMGNLPKTELEIVVTKPLIANSQSLSEVSSALLEICEPCLSDEAILFVGHGTDHEGGLAYPALQYELSKLNKNAYVCILGEDKFEGEVNPSLESVLEILKERNTKKVSIHPLLMVVGVHVKQDIGGEDEGSISSTIKNCGYELKQTQKGLLEYHSITKILQNRLDEALKKINA